MRVPEGQAVVVYGGALHWAHAPPRVRALEVLKARMKIWDAEARKTADHLPYELVDKWSWVSLCLCSSPTRGLPFENVSDLLENEYELTPTIIEASVKPIA